MMGVVVVVVCVWGGVGGVGSLSFDVQGWVGGPRLNSDPFRQTEKGGGGAKVRHFFLDVVNVWSLRLKNRLND